MVPLNLWLLHAKPIDALVFRGVASLLAKQLLALCFVREGYCFVWMPFQKILFVGIFFIWRGSLSCLDVVFPNVLIRRVGGHAAFGHAHDRLFPVRVGAVAGGEEARHVGF